jgi:cytidylate kinase
LSVSTIIAIDGPAASGKSTLGKYLADTLGFLFFDTGVMYRAVTWAALQERLDIDDENAITELAQRIDIDIQPPSISDNRNCDILVNQQDITWKIRSPEVDAHVSVVSAYGGVRKAMTIRQREIGLRGNVVMVGRDIGTEVLPEAGLKIYLEASVEERAHRRWMETKARGEQADFHQILLSMRRRDEIDSTREIAPLRPATDSRILNSDHLCIEQVIELALAWVKEMGLLQSKNNPPGNC